MARMHALNSKGLRLAEFGDGLLFGGPNACPEFKGIKTEGP